MMEKDSDTDCMPRPSRYPAIWAHEFKQDSRRAFIVALPKEVDTDE